MEIDLTCIESDIRMIKVTVHTDVLKLLISILQIFFYFYFV